MVGGSNDNGVTTDLAELVALLPYGDPGCVQIPSLPVRLEGAVGVNIDGVPTVCGGRIAGSKGITECYQYDVALNAWAEAENLELMEGRGYADAVHGSAAWFVIGGDDNIGLSKYNSEYLEFENENFEEGVEPAYPRFLHCAAMIGDDEVFLAGGFDGNDQSDLAMRLNISSMMWNTTVRPLSEPRVGLSCGPVKR